MLVNNLYSGAIEDKCSHILEVGILHSSPGESYTAGVFQVSVWRHRGGKNLGGTQTKNGLSLPRAPSLRLTTTALKCSKYQQTFSKYQQTLLRNFSWYYDHWYFDNWYFVTAQGVVLALDHHRHRHGDRIPGSLTLSDTIFFSSWLIICTLKSVALCLLVLYFLLFLSLFRKFVFLLRRFFEIIE